MYYVRNVKQVLGSAVGWQEPDCLFYDGYVEVWTLVKLQLDFDDVLAEPNAAQGFEWVWKLAFVVFSQTKSWFYKLFAAVVAVPAALIWAVVFALVTVVYIWIVSPALRLFDLNLAIFRRVSYIPTYLLTFTYHAFFEVLPSVNIAVNNFKFDQLYFRFSKLFYLGSSYLHERNFWDYTKYDRENSFPVYMWIGDQAC